MTTPLTLELLMKRLLVALVPLLLVSACGPTELDPTPVPTTPSVSVSSASPSATSEDELYAEAERVFRRAMDIESRWDGGGDFAGFPAEMSDVAMGDYLEAAKAGYEFLAEKGWVGRAGESGSIESAPAIGLVYEDSIAALNVCKQFAGVNLYDQKGNLMSEGTVTEARYYFKRDADGQLKIFYQQYRRVEQCELAS